MGGAEQPIQHMHSHAFPAKYLPRARHVADSVMTMHLPGYDDVL